VSNPNQPEYPEDQVPSRTADLMKPDFRDPDAAVVALRPDAEEGALAWGYLGIVGLLFLGLVFFAWACQDDGSENANSESEVSEPTDSVIDTAPPSTDSVQDVPPSVEVPEQTTAAQITAAQTSIESKLAATKIQFDPNESTIASGESVIAEVATLVKDLDANIKVEGYTDSVGDAEENKTLSEERAQTIKDKLIAAGVSADKITTEGFGETQAEQNNPTTEQKNADRRIEIKVSAKS